MGTPINRNFIWQINSICSAFILKSPLLFYTYIYVFLLDEIQFGYVQLVLAYASITFPIITLNIYAGYGRKLYDYEPLLMNSITQQILKILFLFCACLFCIHFFVSEKFFLPIIILIMSFSWCIDFLHLQKCIKEKNLLYFNIITIGKYSLIFSVFSFIFLNNLSSLLEAVVISEAVGLIFYACFLLKKEKTKVDGEHYKKIYLEIITFSLPLVIYNSSNVIISQIDRIMIAPFLGMSQVAVYSLTYNTAACSLIFINGIFNMVLPRYFLDKKKSKTQNKLTLLIISFSFFGVSVLIYYVFVIYLNVLNIEYPAKYLELYMLVVFSIIPSIFVQYASRELQYVYKTFYLSVVLAFGALSNLALNFLFIPSYGLIGALISTYLSLAIVLLLLLFSLDKREKNLVICHCLFLSLIMYCAYALKTSVNLNIYWAYLLFVLIFLLFKYPKLIQKVT